MDRAYQTQDIYMDDGWHVTLAGTVEFHFSSPNFIVAQTNV